MPITFFVSCDKEGETSLKDLDKAILGTWNRTDIIPSGFYNTDLRYFDIVSTYTFHTDATYSYRNTYYGFKDENPDEIVGQSETNGTYQIKGDSIFIRVKEITSWEKGFKPEPETIEYKEATSYYSRYEIVDRTLTLYYISYPADAPVPTQMSYKKFN